jgi:dephospho-CoA kinase
VPTNQPINVLRVGLTGGVACGKSTIADMFEQRGVRVARADDIARDLMQPGHAVYDEVVRRFGKEILDAGGGIDRRKLAELAFTAKPDGSRRIAELNTIVHPAVIAQQDEWMRRLGEQEPGVVAIVEAALIFEAGVRDHFDKIIVVTCRPDQKVERFAMRTGLDRRGAEKEVAQRSAAQLSDEAKAAAADYVIDNSDDRAAAGRQVSSVFAELSQLAKQRKA